MEDTNPVESLKQLSINTVEHCIKLIELCNTQEEAIDVLKQFKSGIETNGTSVEDEPEQQIEEQQDENQQQKEESGEQNDTSVTSGDN